MKHKMMCNPELPPIRVGRINYMNVAPVYYGIDRGSKPAWFDIISGPPSFLNDMMEKGKIDISPVSSAAYARHQDKWLLLPDFSISCFGRVMSVLLVSRYPFNELNDKKLILTRESATAAALLKLICSAIRVKPIFETGTVKRPEDLDTTKGAGLVIGDAALTGKWDSHFDYVYDLGDMWRGLTGLPFVFAVWAVRKSFAEENPDIVSAVIDIFGASKNAGCLNKDKIAALASEKLGLEFDICRTYYDLLEYELGPEQGEGLKTFFKKLHTENLIPEGIALSFFN